jgi:hypothetical protein
MWVVGFLALGAEKRVPGAARHALPTGAIFVAKRLLDRVGRWAAVEQDSVELLLSEVRAGVPLGRTGSGDGRRGRRGEALG